MLQTGSHNEARRLLKGILQMLHHQRSEEIARGNPTDIPLPCLFTIMFYQYGAHIDFEEMQHCECLTLSFLFRAARGTELYILIEYFDVCSS